MDALMHGSEREQTDGRSMTHSLSSYYLPGQETIYSDTLPYLLLLNWEEEGGWEGATEVDDEEALQQLLKEFLHFSVTVRRLCLTVDSFRLRLGGMRDDFLFVWLACGCHSLAYIHTHTYTHRYTHTRMDGWR
eukprot:GHVU01087681.1.p1 GENE.GHVU01087681.1~~GHVU01087681.1.p1  ORF type:complete len:133 (-),score=15.73 GHVU01087681.1:621-1019(-)